MELDFTSSEVEKLLFKKMLVDKTWMNVMVEHFDERWFKTKNFSGLIKIAIKYYVKYKNAPTAKVMELLAKSYAKKRPDEINESEISSQLSEVMNSDKGIPDEVVNSNVVEFVRKNALSQSLLNNLDILAEAENEKSSEKYELVINKCLATFDRVQKLMFANTDAGLDYFEASAQDAHWEFIKNPDAKIKTGWDAVDHYTNGGFLKDGRMLGLFMAQAGLGKSVFLSNLAVNLLKQNLSVVVISLEMSQDVYAQRFDAHISSKNINKLRENEATARERINEFYKAHENARLVIKEFPPRSVNTNVIDSYLENLKAGGNDIDVIIVDYLNLVVPNKTSDSMFKDGLSVSEELRALSYKYKAPVITAAQCNSEGMNSADIDMQNISESRGIVHTVDFLAALYQTQDQREKGELGFKIIKNRLGGHVGKRCVFRMDPETLTVADVTFAGNLDLSDGGFSEISDELDELENVQNDLSAL